MQNAYGNFKIALQAIKMTTKLNSQNLCEKSCKKRAGPSFGGGEGEGRGGEGAASNGAEGTEHGAEKKKGGPKRIQNTGPKRDRKGTEKGPKSKVV